MTPKAALLGLCLILTACDRPSPPAPFRPCPPSLLAEQPAGPVVEGSVVAPATDEEREATAKFLNGYAYALDWGAEGWRLVWVARVWCEQHAEMAGG